MKKSTKYFFGINIFIMLIIIIISEHYTNNYITQLNTEYAYVTKKVIIFGLVKEMVRFKGNPSVELNSGEKIWFDFASNYNYLPSDLVNFLQIGDTLIKHRNSDTLYIHRNAKEYYFVLKKNVGKRK